MPGAGAHIRDYEVWGRLSEGGMSEVWLAKHAVLLVPVIIKTLRTAVVDLDSSHGFSRMIQEARLMARIPSPKVVRALDAGVHQGIGYVVQEYVDGIDMAELDRERRRALGVGLPLWFVCSVMHDISLALHASHQTGILHRDVKPSNVFGSPQTGIRLGDFGIAIEQERTSVPTEVSGTFKFMAPEQMRGDPLDRAADVYGAGATAYDLRYGRPPYLDLASALDPLQLPRFPAPNGPSEAYFQFLVQEMLKNDPRERPQALAALGRHFGFIGRSIKTPSARTSCSVVGKHKLRLGDCEIQFEVGNIADATADAIVNSAHDHMAMRTGVGEALRVKGGDEIEAAATKAGHQALGTCIATPAGKLDARWVLHAVSAWNEVSCVGRAAYRTFLVAENLGVHSLAMPALGTGASRVSFETSASAIATALRHHLVLGGSRLRRVTFVLRDDQARNVFREVAEEALRDAEGLSATYDVGLACEGEARPDAATHVRASEP